MKILVTGANGMLARAVIAYCKTIGDEVIGLTRQELDIANRTAVFSFFEENEFDAVVNCAAYTDVDGSETNVERCYAVNALGVENLALASRKHDRIFLTVSTDYVFDGTKSGFYTQRDTPNPQGVYAKAKLEGEIRARNSYARSIIVRSGWIYGEGGNNFLSVLPRLLQEKKSVKAINDLFGTPTFAVDLAKRIREIIELDLPLTFHVVNKSEGASYVEFARKVCRFMGLDEGLIEEVSSSSLRRPAPRPKNSRLECLFSERLGLHPLRHWEKTIEEFVQQVVTTV